MYDPQNQLHDQSGEPNYSQADREEEPSEQKAPLYQYYLLIDNALDHPITKILDSMDKGIPLKVDHYEADADHVYVYMKAAP